MRDLRQGGNAGYLARYFVSRGIREDNTRFLFQGGKLIEELVPLLVRHDRVIFDVIRKRSLVQFTDEFLHSHILENIHVLFLLFIFYIIFTSSGNTSCPCAYPDTCRYPDPRDRDSRQRTRLYVLQTGV